MGLKLYQWLIGCSNNFWATYSTAHFVGRKNCRLKVIWLGWCPNSSSRSLFLVKGDSKFRLLFPLLLRVLARVALIFYWEFPLHLVPRSSQRCPPNPVVYRSILSLNPPLCDHSCSNIILISNVISQYQCWDNSWASFLWASGYQACAQAH